MNLMIKIERYFAWRYFTRHANKAATYPYGRLQISTWVPDPKNNNVEKLSSSMSRTSLNPIGDLRAIEATLEFKSAINRGVNITPETLYEHVIGRPYDHKVNEIERIERAGDMSITTTTRFK